MSVGQLITLGIGTPSTIPILTLTGLSAPVTPPPTPGSGTLLPGIMIGVPTSLTANISYALPARAIILEWLSTSATFIYQSVDGITWVQIDLSSGAELRTISLVCGVFIFASVDVIVTAKKYRPRF